MKKIIFSFLKILGKMKIHRKKIKKYHLKLKFLGNRKIRV